MYDYYSEEDPKDSDEVLYGRIGNFFELNGLMSNQFTGPKGTIPGGEDFPLVWSTSIPKERNGKFFDIREQTLKILMPMENLNMMSLDEKSIYGLWVEVFDNDRKIAEKHDISNVYTKHLDDLAGSFDLKETKLD